MIIGTFTATKDGFQGTLTTLTFTTEARLEPTETGGHENAPDFRVFANKAEIGAAWKRTSKGKSPRDYLSLRLDDPSFAAPVYANLVERNNGWELIWVR